MKLSKVLGQANCLDLTPFGLFDSVLDVFDKLINSIIDLIKSIFNFIKENINVIIIIAIIIIAVYCVWVYWPQIVLAYKELGITGMLAKAWSAVTGAVGYVVGKAKDIISKGYDIVSESGIIDWIIPTVGAITGFQLLKKYWYIPAGLLMIWLLGGEKGKDE